MQYLQLENNEVTDLSPLAGLTNMRSLYLTNNQIKDVAPVANLKKLWSLYLGGNQIADIKPLAGLKGELASARLLVAPRTRALLGAWPREEAGG